MAVHPRHSQNRAYREQNVYSEQIFDFPVDKHVF